MISGRAARQDQCRPMPRTHPPRFHPGLALPERPRPTMPARALTLVPDTVATSTVPVTFVLLTREHPTDPWAEHATAGYRTYLEAEIEQVRLAFNALDRAARLDLRAQRATTPLHRKRLERAAHNARTREYGIFVRTPGGDLRPAD